MIANNMNENCVINELYNIPIHEFIIIYRIN